MKLFNWLSIAVASLLLFCTGCPSPAPQKQKVQYASTKSPPDHSNAAPPAQPDKNLKIQKITLAWTPGATKDTWSYKLHQGGSSGSYTNSVITLTTNAVVYVWPSKTYYFDVILITDILDSNGLQETVHCENPYELVYTVPNKPGGPK